jgi:hypothetical protein
VGGRDGSEPDGVQRDLDRLRHFPSTHDQVYRFTSAWLRIFIHTLQLTVSLVNTSKGWMRVPRTFLQRTVTTATHHRMLYEHAAHRHTQQLICKTIRDTPRMTPVRMHLQGDAGNTL